MKLVRRSPDVQVFKDATLFLAFMTQFMLAMGLGFFWMAADPDMRVRDFSGGGKAGPASRIAWIVFGIGCLAGSVFAALQRRAVVIDRRAHTVRELYGPLIPIRSTTYRISDFKQVTLRGDEFSAALLLEGPSKRVFFDSGYAPRIEPLAQALSQHTGLPVVREESKWR
jgi:hypothetical protein